MARVPASERYLKDMLAGAKRVERSALMREAVRLIVEEALEAEVTEATVPKTLAAQRLSNGAVGQR